MSLSRRDIRDLEDMLDIEKEDIISMLEEYPAAALSLAARHDCFSEVMEKLMDILKKYQDLKTLAEEIYARVDKEEEVKITPTSPLFFEIASTLEKKETTGEWMEDQIEEALKQP